MEYLKVQSEFITKKNQELFSCILYIYSHWNFFCVSNRGDSLSKVNPSATFIYGSIIGTTSFFHFLFVSKVFKEVDRRYRKSSEFVNAL